MLKKKSRGLFNVNVVQGQGRTQSNLDVFLPGDLWVLDNCIQLIHFLQPDDPSLKQMICFLQAYDSFSLTRCSILIKNMISIEGHTNPKKPNWVRFPTSFVLHNNVPTRNLYLGRRFLVSWYVCFWYIGFLGSKFLGFKVSWFLGFKVSKFQWSHITKIPFHVFWRILIPYSRCPRSLKRILRIYLCASLKTIKSLGIP